MNKRAVLFKSTRRFQAFHAKLEQYNYEVTVLDFDRHDWIDFDYSRISLIIYFPEFSFSSNHPQALCKVLDNLYYIHGIHPDIDIFPDPRVIPYYADKYRQYLYLRRTSLPTISTVPLLSGESVAKVAAELQFPVVVKNRFGAGGDYVFLVNDRKQLMDYYRASRLDFTTWYSMKCALKAVVNREFWWYLLKSKNMHYPFFSYPLLAQRFVTHDRDLKTVTGFNQVVEAHWRNRSDPRSWKMNIDGGGIGEWSHVPAKPVSLSIELAKSLGAKWLNIDFMCDGDDYYISEFSPVWHHYAYQEKASFVYNKNYNLGIPLEQALDLEDLIVSSYSRNESC
jgi:hypothetical protein